MRPKSREIGAEILWVRVITMQGIV
jgi:hypothetical protein